MGYSRHGYIWTPTRRDLLRSAGGVLAAGLLAPRIARAATFSLVSHWGQGLGLNGGDTSGHTIDTTGASLLIACVANDAGGTAVLSDSKANSWIGLTAIGSMGFRIYYAESPVVGAGHDVTVSGANTYAAVCFAAFSGADLSAPFDGQQHGFDSGGNTGYITPAEDNALVISASFNLGSAPVGGGMTELDGFGWDSGLNSYGCGLAYTIQTTATPVFSSWSGGTACVIASFKPAAGSAAPVRRRFIGG